MNDSDFDFFQDHSRNYLEMALKTDKQELMENPDGYGKRTGVCGDTVEIYLKVRQKSVEAVSYHVDGCVNTNACCNTVAHMAEGKSVDAVWGITPERIMDFLETPINMGTFRFLNNSKSESNSKFCGIVLVQPTPRSTIISLILK